MNRLIKAKGNFEGTSNKADYELNMQYNRLNGIVQKALQYALNGQDKGYTLDYEYNNPKHPHAPSSITELGKPKARNYTYDCNGNPTYYDEFKGFRSMVWDEENRLRGINDNGRLHLYTYDHTGERALKSSAESSMAVINGLASAVITHTEDYTAYVSPYFVVQKGKFTKHYFEGATRIVSKLGEGTFSHKNTGIMAGGLDYLKRTQKEQEARDRYIKGLNVPPGPPTQHGIYASPEWTGKEYPSIDWAEISQNQEPPAGWPRYPKFNEPGDVPGPPVQFGEPVTNNNVKAGYGFIPNGVEEKNLYYYHPDHLGSSSYITDKNGEVIQHTEYMAFGEVLVDEHSTTNKMPYLFNGKELDFETGLYYYGARYYDAKISLWLNTDPLMEKYPEVSPYTYTLNNPIMLIDPTGEEPFQTGPGPKKTFPKLEPVNYTIMRKMFRTLGMDNKVSKDKGIYSLNSKGLALITTYEGLSLSMYDQDGAKPGNATIGFGHLIHKGLINGSPSEKEFEKGITLNKAAELFIERIKEHEGYIDTYMDKFDINLNADQYAAMVDLSFNKGPDDALKIMKIYKEKGKSAAGEAIMNLNKGNKGLQVRRRFEKELFINSIRLTKTGTEELIKKENEQKKNNK